MCFLDKHTRLKRRKRRASEKSACVTSEKARAQKAKKMSGKQERSILHPPPPTRPQSQSSDRRHRHPQWRPSPWSLLLSLLQLLRSPQRPMSPFAMAHGHSLVLPWLWWLETPKVSQRFALIWFCLCQINRSEKLNIHSWLSLVPVFFDMEVGGEELGRITFELRADVAPKTAENFVS